jgi:hypothetical protein
MVKASRVTGWQRKLELFRLAGLCNRHVAQRHSEMDVRTAIERMPAASLPWIDNWPEEFSWWRE